MCVLYICLMCAIFFLRPHNVAGAPSFTSRGFKYYDLFNMKLCGDKYEESVCSSNISLSTGQSVSNISRWKWALKHAMLGWSSPHSCFTLRLSNRRGWVGRSWVWDLPWIHDILYTLLCCSQQRFCPQSVCSVITEWLLRDCAKDVTLTFCQWFTLY